MSSWKSKSYKKKGLHSRLKCYKNELPREDAVVIGKRSPLATLWNTNTSSVAHEKRQASKADGISTYEDEQSQPRLSPTGKFSGKFAWVDLGLENGATEVNDTGSA